MKILLFSPIRKNIEVLKVTIPSWFALNQKGIELSFLLFDDNDDNKSSNYLNSFKDDRIEIINFDTIQKDNYDGDHNWNLQQIDRIAEIKNYALKQTIDEKYDAVFLVDADLVLHPESLISLVNSNKNFIFKIFWTDFLKDGNYRPNCWDFHSWNYDNADSILQLKEKGVFQVGAGGACTLIKNELINKGLTFNRIPNMRFNGEDRHICSRVYALGSEVYVDTNYPSYHIHDVNKYKEAEIWYKNGAKQEFFLQWLDDKWENKVTKQFKPLTSIFLKIKRSFYLARRTFINSLK